MKKIDFGQAITILANVGVVVGIIILVVEIDQNNDALAFQARAMLTAARTAQQETIVQNAGGIVDLMDKVRRGDELTWADEFRLNVRHSNVIRNYEALYREVVNGTLTEDDIPIPQWRGTLLTDIGLREWFERNALEGDLDPDFVRFVREMALSD